jgi:hypothetical protein
MDPDFTTDDHGPVSEIYTLDALHDRFGRSP